MELVVRNVNQAFSEIFWKLKVLNIQPQETRNGPAIVYPEMVTTVYQCPTERVLFHGGRDANPIFHLMESIWMLAGRNDVAFLQQFNKRMADFSDDGKTFNAAYGHRWRTYFGHDQLDNVIKLLRREPNTRQAVVQIWCDYDLVRKTKDKACNMQIIFDTRNGVLNMTVINRSNDIWWGAYGANAVHFSFLQEFVAAAVDFNVGVYRQVSNNFHLYTELYNAKQYLEIPPDAATYDYYAQDMLRPRPIMLNRKYKVFLTECEMFCADPYNEFIDYTNPFFAEVAHQMAMISKVRKEHTGDGRDYAIKILAEDWRRAAFDWIERRDQAREVKENDARKKQVAFCEKIEL